MGSSNPVNKTNKKTLAFHALKPNFKTNHVYSDSMHQRASQNLQRLVGLSLCTWEKRYTYIPINQIIKLII
jgi:hypothetical protein